MGKLSKVKGIKQSTDKKLAEAFTKAFKESKKSIEECAKKNEAEKEWLAQQDWEF